MPKKGKKGAEQRTKGNVKTASSGRMAELMGGDQGFIGFEVVSSDTNGSHSEDGLSSVHSSFQVVLKQMGKRDTTTKLKALNEFVSLCEREPVEAVVSCLKLWPLMYCKVSMDNDHRVREMSHSALKSCGLAAKKHLGPHVRSIMGSWVSGMCDPHLLTATMAKGAFTAVFTPDKQKEVYKFALKDIVTFVRNLILNETADTFTDPKIYPEDERVERYDRAVAMAIGGLGHTVRELGVDYLYEEGVEEVWQGVVREGRVWRLSRHKNPLVRSSVFGLVCSLADSTHYLSSDYKHFTSLVLGGLSEKDPVVIGPLWDAVLYLIDTHKDWPSHVNIQKGVLPGLWSLLEGGCHGNGPRVYPSLLPLLHGLMSVYSEDIGFCVNYLQRMSKGFLSESARISLSTTEAILSSFKECFVLILKYNKHNAIKLIDIVLELFDSVMSDDVTMQFSVISNGVAMTILSASKLVSKDDESPNELDQYCQERLIARLSDIISNNDCEKQSKKIGDFLTSFPVPSVDHTHQSNLIVPVVCEVCAMCLTDATPTRISLAQRLMTHFMSVSEQLVNAIHHRNNPDQSVDSTQLEQVVDHMISLCGANEGAESRLIDCVVSLLCNGRKEDRLMVIAKENPNFAPLILKKVAEKGYDVTVLVESIGDIVIPPKDLFDEAFKSPYFVELLNAMLTVDGLESLKRLPLSGVLVEGLCSVLMDHCSSDIVEVLCELDPSIIKVNQEALTKLLNHLRVVVYNCQDNLETAVSPNKLINCYSHILQHLPNLSSYLSTVTADVLQRVSKTNTAHDILWLGVCYRYLHCTVLDTFESVYDQFTSVIDKADEAVAQIIPLTVFEKFCSGSLLYSPPIDSTPLILQSSLPSSLYPFLLIGVCLFDDKDILQEIGEGKFVASTVTSPAVTVNGNEDVIVPALFYASAVSIYSNKDSVAHYVCQSFVKQLLDRLQNVSKLVTWITEQSRTGPMWCLCLNHLLLSSECNGTLLQCICDNACELEIQLVLYQTQNNQIVNDIQKQSLEDPCAVTGCLLLVRNDPVIIGAAMSLLSSLVDKHNKKELTILEEDSEACKDPMVFSVLELIVQLLKLRSLDLDAAIWEFIMCQSVSIVQLITDSFTDISSEGVVMFCRGLSLCLEVEACPKSDSIAMEWKEFFMPTIREMLLPYFQKVKGSSQTADRVFLHYYLCRAMIELSVQPSIDQWEGLVAMVATCQLYSEQVAGLLLAVRLLDKMTIKCTGDNTDGMDISSIQSIIGSFLFNIDLEVIFDNVDCVDYEYHYQCQQAVSYQLLWILICEVVGKCDIEARVIMTEWIKERCQLNVLLQKTFPHCSSSASQHIKGVGLHFSFSNISNTVFFSVAQHLPPMLRQWFNALDKQMSSQVMNFTSKIVTPKLWSNEVKNIHNSKPKASDLEVKVYSSAMEVSVAYRLEDFSIELSVIVPDCYPLLSPAIKEGKRARVDVNLWRKWLLQLSAFVANQNGSLLEGLMVWKSNLDKHFAGLEDCMICFSVIHGSNYSLPKMCCRTCKKKFHSTCLYKWFSTSAKSTCPLCRNVF